MVLAGDVGGTKTNLAIYKAVGSRIELVLESTYPSSEFSSCIDILKKFKAEHCRPKS